jgi:ABC-type transport system involved in multi-copper enzyme maturation permease subunit
VSDPAPDTPAPAALRRPLAERLAAFLSPRHLAWAIPGPIFHKEVWVSGRRPGTYWIRGLYALGLIGLVSLVFVAERADRTDSPSQRLQSLQQLAPQITLTVVWFQYVALTLASIILASPVVCDEKRAGTLGALLTTPLRAWQIVLGKLAALYVQLLILALISTPLLLAIRLFGGVTAEIVLAALCISLSSAALASTLGVLHSIGARRAPMAAGGTLVTLLGTQFIVPLLVWAYWTLAGGGMTRAGPGLFVMGSPPIALGFASAEVVAGGQIAPAGPVPFWAYATAWNLALAVAAFVVASWRLRVAMTRESEGGAPVPAPRAAPTTARTAPAPTTPMVPPPIEGAPPTVPVPRKRPAMTHAPVLSREVGDQPILWRETRQPVFRRRLYFWIAAGSLLMLLSWVYFQVTFQRAGGGGWTLDLDDLAQEELNYPIAVVGSILTLILACFGTGSLLAGEKESRTWEVLLTTPLSAWEIVWGKFLGSLRRQWPIPLAVGAHFLFVSLASPVRIAVIPLLASVILGGLLAVTATGVFCSQLVGKSVRASALNFALWMGLWAGVPLVTGIIGSTVFDGTNFETLMATVCSINPVGMAVVCCTGSVHRSYGTPTDFEYFGAGRMSLGEFALVAGAFLAVYAGFSLLVLRAAARMLADRTQRAR